MDLSTLRDLLRCYVCAGDCSDGLMCPRCSKYACAPCLRRWVSLKNECPHCRARIRTTDLVPCSFLRELADQLSALAIAASPRQTHSTSSSSTSGAPNCGSCSIHALPLLYYCATCCKTVCPDCAMFTDTHRGHDITRAAQHYAAQMRRVEDLCVHVEKNLTLIDAKRKQLEDQVFALDADLRNGRSILSDARLRLTTLPQDEFLLQAPVLIGVLESHREVSNATLSSSASASSSVSATSPTVTSPTVTSATSTSSLAQSDIQLAGANVYVPNANAAAVEFEEPIEFRESSFVISFDRPGDVVYSPLAILHGCGWRLKVYPSGNGVARGSHISVFLEMMHGPLVPTTYQYFLSVETPETEPLRREFSSDFHAGECWGYNRFARLDGLLNGPLVLRYGVRPVSLMQLARDLQRYNEMLEERLLRMDEIEEQEKEDDEAKDPADETGQSRTDQEQGDSAQAAEEEAAHVISVRLVDDRDTWVSPEKTL